MYAIVLCQAMLVECLSIHKNAIAFFAEIILSPVARTTISVVLGTLFLQFQVVNAMLVSAQALGTLERLPAHVALIIEVCSRIYLCPLLLVLLFCLFCHHLEIARSGDTGCIARDESEGRTLLVDPFTPKIYDLERLSILVALSLKARKVAIVERNLCPQPEPHF